jgi:ferredoxin
MPAKKIKVIFIEGDQEREIEALVGLSILEVAHNNDIDLEGACEGSLACATCHVVLEDKIYNMLDEPEEAEEDMLDLAFGLTHTSRLGCQIILTKELDGMRIKLPSATRNINW